MRADGRQLAAVFVGGFAGTITRAQLGETLAHDAGAWPLATQLANLAGAFLLGYVAALLRDRGMAAELRLRLLGTGFCGALTTFSTLQLELLTMLDDGAHELAAAYVLVSLGAGLAAVAAGRALGRNRRGASA